MSKKSVERTGNTIEAVRLQYPETRKSPQSFRIFFVGKDTTSASLSVFSDHDVIAAPNFYQANIILNRLYAQTYQLPDVIMGEDDKKDARGLHDFLAFLGNNQILSAIPFLMVNAGTTINSKPKSIKGVDDIVRPDINPDKFVSKINLLRKFKFLQQQKNRYQEVKKDIPNARRVLYKFDGIFKRVMDIIISAVALTILSPLMLIIAILIKIDSRGPVFYKSYRAGSNYRVFKFIKFRTMVAEADHNLSDLMAKNQYAGADKKAVFVKISNDPRITHFGKFLRNSSLDEIPQLFNVLKGDMSLVGNRPLPLYEARSLTMDSTAERFNAPAGITGLWQISKRGQKEMSASERIALDIQYARQNSFAQDIQIMLKTPKALIQKENV